jgi:hypothetical protein
MWIGISRTPPGAEPDPAHLLVAQAVDRPVELGECLIRIP